MASSNRDKECDDETAVAKESMRDNFQDLQQTVTEEFMTVCTMIWVMIAPMEQ